MADDVTVKFGAQIDALVAAVTQIKGQLDGVVQHTGRVTAQVDKMAGAFEAFGSKFRQAFTAASLWQFVVGVSALGEAAEQMGQRLGTSVENIGLLTGIAQLSNQSMDTLAVAIERMSLSVQNANRDAFGPQAQALKVLGLNARDLIGIPTDQYLEKIADAVSRLEPSLNRTNAVMAIGGRGIAQMIPLLQNGAAGFREMAEQIRRTGSIMTTEQASAFGKTNDAIDLMLMSLKGVAITVFDALNPSIYAAIKSVTEFIQWVNDGAKGGNILADALSLLGGAARVAATALAALLTTLMAIGEAITAVFKLAAGEIAEFENFAKEAVGRFEKLGRDFKERIREIWSTPAQVTVTKDGRAAGALGGGRDQVEAARARIEAEMAVEREAFAQRRILIENQAALWQITDNAKFAAMQEAARREFEMEARKLQQIRDLWPQHSKEWELANAKMLQAAARFNTEMVRLNAESVQSMAAKFNEIGDAMTSSFNGSLRGLLAGTTSWAQAFKAVLGDMLIFFIQMIERMVVRWIAGQLAQVAASQSAEGAKAAAAIAGEEVTLPIRVAKFVSDITADAALVFAGIFANLSPIMGPAAAGPAAGGQATVLAQLANVPKFESGTDFVPYTGLAMVHQGEAIIPADRNRAGGGSTSVQTSFNIRALDGASVERWLKRGGAEMIAKHLAGAVNRNRSLRPAY